ncbi:11383_t:CDS:2 [Ambispora gerdemannii]|uniref:11383_t:CDS:1 n=1 Tax=Ambispora gerdemannii TaxID=144530 RepID=A0A9N8W0C9_9GLOM|nr:11383_t:CDS:2 [Ambispora gerdemannii]
MSITNKTTTNANTTFPPSNENTKNDNDIQQLQKEKKQLDTSFNLGKSPYPAWTFSALCLASSPLGMRKFQGVPSYFQCMAFGAIFGFSGYMLKREESYISRILATSIMAREHQQSIKSRKPIPITLSTVALANAIVYGKESWF